MIAYEVFRKSTKALFDNKIFRLKYNFLAFVNVGFGMINSILTMRIFGLSYQADSWFIASAINAALSFIPVLLIEQFIYFYNDIKVRSRDDAKKFYNVVISFSGLLQIFFVGLLCYNTDILIHFFAANIDPTRFELTKAILKVFVITMIFLPYNTVTTSLLNAEMRFSIPFILAIVPVFNSSLVLYYMMVTKNSNIVFLAYSLLISAMFVTIVQFFLVKGMGFRYRFSLRSPVIKAFVINSFAMRFGHNMNNFFVQPIISNVVSSLSVGNAAAYSYGSKFITTIQAVVIGPSLNVFRSKIALLWSQNVKKEIAKNTLSILFLSLLLLIPSIVICYICIPYLLRFISSGKFTERDISLIRNIFLLLSVWVTIVTIEAPFVQIINAAKKSIVLIRTNTINIVIIFLVVTSTRKYLSLFSIPVGLIAGQIFNVITYIYLVTRMLKK